MSGAAALGALMVGAVLIAVECNRPGRVLPGAAGVLLVLVALHALLLLPHGTAGVGVAVAGMALVTSTWWRPLRGLPGAVGTGMLTGAMAWLSRESGEALPLAASIACGLMLGGGASLLLAIAGRARRAKRRGQAGGGAERLQAGWGE